MNVVMGEALAQANPCLTQVARNYPVFGFCRINKTLERYQGCCFNPDQDNSIQRETQVCVCRNSLFNLYYCS